MHIVHLFVSYAHVNLCHFFSSSWCRGLAALLLVALPGLFCLPFSSQNHTLAVSTRLIEMLIPLARPPGSVNINDHSYVKKQVFIPTHC